MQLEQSPWCRFCGPARESRPRGWKRTTAREAFLRHRDGDACVVCGLDVPRRPCPWPLRASIEHLVPRSKTGSNCPCNLALSHYRCNMARKIAPLPLPESSLRPLRRSVAIVVEQWLAGNLRESSIAEVGTTELDRADLKRRESDERRLAYHEQFGGYWFGRLPAR